MGHNLWKKLNGTAYINTLNETAWRIVETQEITATRKLVNSFDEQIILEEMIESIKPALTNQFHHYHYLLFTPFRYPPLRHGSRFGTRSEHALWYGSLALHTAMSEKAYYQLNFLRASSADFGTVEVPLTAFSTQIKTQRGIKLQAHPFSNYTNLISSPTSYQTSQLLGSAMRHDNIHALSYQSARDPHKGTNIALFRIDAFLHKKPDAKSFQSWRCIANNQLVEFMLSHAISTETHTFSIETFLCDGALTFPAN